MLKYLSLQSKLILLVLTVSLLTALPIAYIGYRSGEKSMRANIYDLLAGQRQTRATQCREMLLNTKRLALTFAASEDCRTAFTRFQTAFQEIVDQGTQLNDEELLKLREFYEKDFLPKLRANSEGNPSLDTFMPVGNAALYLQYHYIAKHTETDYEHKKDLSSAELDIEYDRVHRELHPKLLEWASRFDFDDFVFVDPNGTVVYSTGKQIEFGTNLALGPHAQSNEGELFRILRNDPVEQEYQFADFARYKPGLDLPAAFVGVPIFKEGKFLGALLLQFPTDQFVRILTGNRSWAKEGLQSTGEVYLVGRDKKFRTRSRFMMEHPEKALEDFSRAGIPQDTIDQIRKQGTVLLTLPVDTYGVQQALQGRTGTAEYLDYRNQPVVGSYAPFDFDGNRWAILAEMDSAEAFAPLSAFTKRVIGAATGVGLFSTLLGIAMSFAFTRPLKQLTDGATRLANGEMGTQVVLRSQDEYRELATAFNSMSTRLKDKTDELENKVRENEELMLNILPAPAAARLKEGDTTSTQKFSDVSVMFAEILGLSNLHEKEMSHEASLDHFRQLVIAFDDAAERYGVEKVTTAGISYLAVCGLSIPRPDHVQRLFDFAVDLTLIVDRFNREHNSQLLVQIGMNSGPVIGGVVGRNKFIYDLWGDTVNIAKSMRGGNQSAIRCTQAIRERLGDVDQLEAETDSEDGRRIWRWCPKSNVSH